MGVKVRIAQATTIYEMVPHEDEEFGDSTLHWIEGDLDLKTEKMRGSIRCRFQVACKDLQPIEELIGKDRTLDS